MRNSWFGQIVHFIITQITQSIIIINWMNCMKWQNENCKENKRWNERTNEQTNEQINERRQAIILTNDLMSRINNKKMNLKLYKCNIKFDNHLKWFQSIFSKFNVRHANAM